MKLACWKCGKLSPEIRAQGVTPSTRYLCPGPHRQHGGGRPRNFSQQWQKPEHNPKTFGMTDSPPEQWEMENRVRMAARTEAEFQSMLRVAERFKRMTRIPGLTEEQWKAARLVLLQRYSLRKAAEEMGVSHTRVADLVASCKEQFHELLKKYGGRFGPQEMAREHMGLGPEDAKIRRRIEAGKLSDHIRRLEQDEEKQLAQEILDGKTSDGEDPV